MSTPANDSTIIDAAIITSQNIPALECMDKALADLDAVSYTHLTLPTILLV